MTQAYYEAMEAGVAAANLLVRALEGAKGSARGAPASTHRVQDLVSRIEQTIGEAAKKYQSTHANRSVYQALEALDALRAAIDGDDWELVRAGAHQLMDHLVSAREAAARAEEGPAGAEPLPAGAKGGVAPAGGPSRRWKFGPGGPEEVAPPPSSPVEEPNFGSAAIERLAEAHFTPGSEEEP